MNLLTYMSGKINDDPKNNGELEKVAVGISGNIRLVNVVVGQQIHTGTLLVRLEDDLLITGCE